VLFRPTVEGKEKFWAIPRLSLNPNANIHDFRPALIDKFGRHGDPEDYEIWCDQKPLDGPLIHGLAYEIVPRVSPGHFKPAERRNSIDFGLEAKARARYPTISPSNPPKSAPCDSLKQLDWTPPPLIRTADPAREIPPQWRVQVVYQADDAPEKEWRGWFTEEDTEYAIERRARSVLGIFGPWRRLSYWRDNTGIRMVMTNRQKEITMRYSVETDREIKEVTITETDTVRVILSHLKAKSNFHLADVTGKPFGMEDFPFGYVSSAINPPLQLLHGSALKGKVRDPTPRKDNRIAVETKFKDEKYTFIRGAHPTYAMILEDVISRCSISDPCHIERVRAEEDRIFVDIELGEDAHWFTEKACPPLKLSEDRILAEATGTGGLGSQPSTSPMQTRAAKAAAGPKKATRIKDVFLHNLESEEMEPIGKAVEYGDAIALAHKSGKVPKRFNVAVTDANDERILIGCKKGVIAAGDGAVSAVTAPKPKTKKVPILPEKLIGRPKNPEVAFAPRDPIPEVPGILNASIIPSTFKRCFPRPLDPAVGFWDIRVEILGEQTRKLRVRKDVTAIEILAQTFMGVDLADDDRVKIVVKPLKMENGANFKVEKFSLKTRLALTVQIWDGTQRRCGIEVIP
jgi:hypothetical protein